MRGLTFRNGVLLAALALAGCKAPPQQPAATDAFPPIHDVTTSLTSLPAFVSLAPQLDRHAAVPDRGRDDLKGLSDDVRWRMWHVEAYPKLRPIVVPWALPETMRRIQALATQKGWTIALAEPGGHLEATDGSGGANDDIAINARPATESDGTVIDMRSASRGGAGDHGRNARRIGDFLEALKATAAAK